MGGGEQGKPVWHEADEVFSNALSLCNFPKQHEIEMDGVLDSTEASHRCLAILGMASARDHREHLTPRDP